MYYLITLIRNFLFDKSFIKSIKHQNVFVLCVGNLCVGGSGKTPMTEYLIKHLNGQISLAVVSLGYKRKTKGLREVTTMDTYLSVGDEPKQMKTKFPSTHFFVCKNRNTAISYIQQHYPDIKLIILDDAFQYRYTIPSCNIILSDYSRPFFSDRIMPYGRLRERKSEAKRATYIIYTKCPNQHKDLSEQTKRYSPNAKIFYSHIKYLPLNIEDKLRPILFLSGISNPQPAINYLKEQGYNVVPLIFPDHHIYTDRDILHIKSFEKTHTIVTTEKDATRLNNRGIEFHTLKIEHQIEGNFIEDLISMI